MTDNLKTKTVNGVIWSAVERYSLQAVQFLLSLIIARLLSPSDYGLIGMLAIFMSVSQIFIDGGFSNALIQKKNRTEDDYSTVFYINVGASLVIYLLLFLSAPLIAGFYEQPLLKPIVRVYSANLIINSLAAINRIKLVVSVDFKTQSRISLGAAVLSGVVGIICAYQGMGVWALVVQMMLDSVLNVTLSFYYVRWFPRLKFSSDSFHGLFRYGSKLLIASIINAIFSNIYTLIIGKTYSAATLGFYSRSDHFAAFAGKNVSSVLQRVSFPILSEIQDDNNRLIAAYKKYIKVSTWATFPVLLGLCGVAKPLILVLLTEKWAECTLYLQILCFAYLWDCVTLVNLNLLYVKGRSDWFLRLEIIKKTIGFAILIITLFFNLYIICIGRVIYSIIALYLNTYYTNKLFHYSFALQIRDLLPQLLLSLFMSGCCLLLVEMIDSSLVALIVSVITGVLVYWAGSHSLKLEGYQEFSAIVRKRMHRRA